MQEYDEYDEYNETSPKVKDLQPGWKNAPTVEKLNSDIRLSEPDFNSHVSAVKDFLDLRDGKLNIKIPDGQSKYSPKVIRKQYEWRYSALEEPLLASPDMFDVDPATYNDKMDAVENAKVINKQFDQDINRNEFINKYVRTTTDEGMSILRVGWEYEEETEIVEVEELEFVPITTDPEQMQRIRIAVQAGQMDPADAMQQVPTGRMVEEEQTIVIVNKPTIQVCDYDKVIIDSNANGDLKKARFIGYQFKTSYSELVALDKYENLDSIQLDSADSVLNSGSGDDIDDASNFEDKARKEFWVTEYWGDWDIHDNGTTVPIVATYAGTVMIGLEENPFPDQEPPFVMVVYLPVRNAVYPGEPDAVLIGENQEVIGAVTRGMIDLMGKSANAQLGISADALDTAQKIRFEQGKDYLFNPGVDPTKAFFMGTYPEIPRSAMEMIQLQNNDAESLTGVKAFTDGISGQALGSTATGIRSAMDATSKRELGILRRLSFGLVQIGRKIATMNAVNLSDEEIQKITDGEVVSINRDPRSIVYDLKISVSTPEKDNEKAQDLSFMLQTIGNGMDPSLQQIILSEIATLKEMPVLAKKLIDFQPQPDPLVVKRQELEVQLLQAQIANETSQGNENMADEANKYSQVGLNEAKTATEQAKARALNSSSDNDDLDFLHKQNGTDHKQAVDMEDKKLQNDLERKGADSLLNTETPRETSGERNGQVQTGGQEAIPVIDTPEENLMNNLNVRI